MTRLNQRSITLGLLAVYAVLCLLLAATAAGNLEIVPLVSSLTGGLIFSALTFAYARGWEPARLVALVAITLLASFSMDIPVEHMPIEMVIVPVMALIMGGSAWVAGAGVFQLVVCVARAYLSSPDNMGAFGTAAGLLIYAMPVFGLVLGRLMLDNLRQIAEANAGRAEQALARAERAAADLARQADDLARRNDEQGRLLDLIATLETPAVALAEGVLLAPVVGALDSRRAQALTDRLLREVSQRRARHIVLDIAGVAHVDTEVAGGLLRLVQALRLLGCAVTITGISAPVAGSLTSLGINLGDVRVARSPQDVLAISA